MPTVKTRVALGLIVALCRPVFALDIELEPIVIDKSQGSLAEFNSLVYNDITNFIVDSSEEIVDYFPYVDLRKRASFGIAQDLSIRGSIFEDNGIYINGIRINDPQTGHFSLEIPFTSQDLEAVRIEPNKQKVHFVIKKPKASGFIFQSVWGDHALRKNLISTNFSVSNTKNRFSYEHKISSGARQDTDFQVYNASLHSLWEKGQGELELILATTKRDFGAGSFYSSLYPHQEEHINQRLFILKSKNDTPHFSLINNIYFRRHSDKFILNRHDPSFYTNYHTTYLHGLAFEVDFPEGKFLGFSFDREKITSTNLGNYYRQKKEFSLGVRSLELNNWLLGLALKEAYYGSFGWQDTVDFNITYRASDDLGINFLFYYGWRSPSFTELYYSSPANVGEADLAVQKTANFEFNLDYGVMSKCRAKAGVFYRRQHDTIDWVKNNDLDPWQAMSTGKLNAKGADFSLNFIPDSKPVVKASLGYTYLVLDKASPYIFSKYLFNYIKHRIVTILGLDMAGFSANIIGSFNKPFNRRSYFLCDLRIAKNITQDMNIFVEGKNIFNTGFEELQGIKSEGRWCKLGLEIRF